MRVLLEPGIDPCSTDISSEFAEPCFGATAPHRVVSENTCYRFHLRFDASGPLVEENSPAKSDLDTTQPLDVVFSSDRSVYEFQSGRDTLAVGLCAIGYNPNDRFAGKPFSEAKVWTMTSVGWLAYSSRSFCC